MCAYAPGVQSQAGQFYMQGMAGLGEGIAKGIQGYAENKKQDAALTGVIEAFGPKLQPLSQKMTPDGQKMVEKFLTGKASLKDKMSLAGALQAANKLEEDEQQRKMREAQMAQMAQQTEALKREMDQQRRAQEAMARAAQPVSPMGSAIQGGATFEQLPPGASTQPHPPNSQEIMRRFLQSNAPVTPEVARIFGVMGQMEGIQARANVPRAPVKAVDPYQFRTVDEKGAPVMQTMDRFTGNTMGKPGPVQKPPQVPDPLLNSMYQDFSKERQERVLPALSSLRAYDEIEKILKSDAGEVISGAFANAELFGKRLGAALGMSSVDVKNTETMRSLFAIPVAQIIRNFGAGTGLSDADREFAARAAGGDITLNPQTIKELVRIGKEASANIQAQYEERLETAFPDDADSPAHKQIRRALMLPKGGTVKPTAKTPASAPTGNAADDILRKHGLL